MIYMMSGLVIACCTTLITISYVIRRRACRELATAVRARHDYEDRVDPFEAYAYLDRLEAVYLSILETAQPVDWTIVLWLGSGSTRTERLSGSGAAARGRSPAEATELPELLGIRTFSHYLGPCPPIGCRPRRRCAPPAYCTRTTGP